MSSLQFKNKVYIVSGGSEGLGYSMTKALALQGASVVIASRDEVKGVNAKNEIQAVVGDVGKLDYIQTDIAVAEDNARQPPFCLRQGSPPQQRAFVVPAALPLG